MTRAMRILAEIGEGWAFDRFAHALDDTLEDPGEVLAFASLVGDERKTHLAVRAGKTVRRSGASVPQITYPEIALPEGADFVEPALVLGLSRQESEFNPDAYSSAQARGMMQLLSSTARITANKEGIEWAPDRLIGDPSYNMTLGSAHLSHLLERFGGSYVMVLAGYNAGPHRVTQWVDRFGDPRDPNVDPVDWVELIPFSETRNYVMRVLENVQIYRSRLEGGPIAGRLAADLTRGGGAAEAIANSGTSLRLAGRADGRSSVLALPDAAPEAVSALPEAPPPPTLAPNGD
jgi:soluble lytic murein transglycosylase